MYILKNAQLIFTYRMTARMSDYLYTHPYNEGYYQTHTATLSSPYCLA